MSPKEACVRALIGLLSLCLAMAAVPSVSAQTAVERGRYLVEILGACGNCHTPKGPQGDVPGLHLAGGFQLDDSSGTWITPNITPDPETGIGRWTDTEVIRAIREGRGRDGRTLGPPMPFDLYRRLADSDVNAMVAYLRTVVPVRNAVARSRYTIPSPRPTGRRSEWYQTRRATISSSTASIWRDRWRTARSVTRRFSPRADPTPPGWAREGSRSAARGA